MRITAHVGVLDEIELIERVIAHLRAIGVDHIVACDMGSTDGTLDVLDRHGSDGFSIARLTNDTSWEVWQRTAIETIKATPSDWVMFMDADEFWLPASGSLKNCQALSSAEIVTVDRYNVPATRCGPAMPAELCPSNYDGVLLYCKPIDNLYEHMKAHPEVPWIRGVPMPKILARMDLVETIMMGGHDLVISEGQTAVRRMVAKDLLIAHVPFSTLSRFERRMKNLETFFALNENYFTGMQGWHWKRWHALAQQGRTAEEYERQLADPRQISEFRAQRLVRSAAEIMRDRMTS